MGGTAVASAGGLPKSWTEGRSTDEVIAIRDEAKETGVAEETVAAGEAWKARLLKPQGDD